MNPLLLSAGNAPAAPSGAPIRSPAWWRAKYSLASDLAFFSRYITDDSVDHYTLGLGVCGNARMGEAVGENACYDRAYYYLNSLVAISVTVAGGYKGWYSAYYGGAETSLNEIYCWRFAPDLLVPTSTIPLYASQHAALKAFLEQHIWTKWHSRGVQTHLYRSVLHIAAHWAKLALYLRTFGSTATIRSQAATVLDAIDHVGMPNWSGKSIRTQLLPHPNNPDAHFWKAFWASTATQELNGSDVSHAMGGITYMSEAVRLGYAGWGTEDVRKLLLMKDQFWTPTADWAYLRGPGTGTRAGKYTELGTLGQHDRAFQQQLEADEVRGIASGSEKWGTFALNAARLGPPYLP